MLDYERFTERAQDAVARAHEFQRYYGHPQLDTAHLLLALLKQTASTIPAILDTMAVDRPAIRRKVTRLLADTPKSQISAAPVDQERFDISPQTRRLIEIAEEETSRLGDDLIDQEHLFLGIASEHRTEIASILADAGITYDTIRSAIEQMRETPPPRREHVIRQVAFAGPLGTLRGMFHVPQASAPADNEPVSAVMLLHGFTGNHIEDQRLFVQAADALVYAGFAVLRFDFFGSGDSDGTFDQFTIQTEVNDATAAIDWLGAQPAIDPDSIGVIGLSLGGGVASLLAGQDPRVKAVVLWNAVGLPAHHPLLIKADNRIGGLLVGPDFTPTLHAQDITGALRRYNGPGLVIQATDDETISLDEAQALADALGSRGEMHTIGGADHTFRHPDWRRDLFDITTRWLVAHLAPAGQ
ncbi:MAG: alpha/beta fold hydrolase [Anaerolineae bacterium]|nr:alpha/beta fold hydrolase [Anaerolineae bacterium]